MSQPVPDDLKVIMPFLKRAQELEGKEPVIAYYCRFYAVKLGMSKRNPANKSVVQSYLMTLLAKLEEDKKKLQGNEAITDDNIGKDYVRNFAMKIFLKADNEDRAGNATSKTARTFFIASTFLELLRTFGETEPEINEKIKYAKWKAADILKAEKEGRKPTPGPPGGDDGFQLGEGDGFADGESDGQAVQPATQSFQPTQPTQPMQPMQPFQPMQPMQPTPHNQGNFGLQDPTFNPSAPFYSTPPTFFPTQPPPPITMPVAAPRNKASITAPPTLPTHFQPLEDDDLDVPKYDPLTISNAQKFARFAISALQYEDVPTALENLAKSMALLQAAQNSAHQNRR